MIFFVVLTVCIFLPAAILPLAVLHPVQAVPEAMPAGEETK